ncbi:MAG: hypothetical protein ACYTGS_17960, partial [Planctomycetota bacterium]
ENAKRPAEQKAEKLEKKHQRENEAMAKQLRGEKAELTHSDAGKQFTAKAMRKREPMEGRFSTP